MKKLLEWIDAIRLRRLLTSLKKTRRKPVLRGLSELREIAIVYHAGNPEATGMVLNWAAALRKRGTQVRTLGYFDEKKLPEGVQARLHTDYFCRRDLGNSGKPAGSMLQTFASHPVDMLINLCEGSPWPVCALLAHSAARCKLGKEHTPESAIYDLLFSVPANLPLYKQTGVIEKYLEMIHTRHEKI